MIITILLSISLIGYSYSYNFNDVLKSEFELKTVYNTGNNNAKIGPFTADLLNISNVVEEVNMLNNKEIYDEYILKMWIDNNSDNYLLSKEDDNYLVNIEVFY